MKTALCVLGLAAALAAQTARASGARGEAALGPAPTFGWPAYGATAAGNRYSPARQITAANVSHLKLAWAYHTGLWQELAKALTPEQLAGARAKAAFEATPILHQGTLYLTTPIDEVIALDASTGRERWRFNPNVPKLGYSEISSRGVAWWQAATPAARRAACGERILFGTLDARLIALDARTGAPCQDFGAHGEVNLTAGVDLHDPGNFQITSAPTVIGDRVVVGSSIGDNRAVSLERGVVRGYDIRTGALVWTWDPIPWAAHENPRTGAANAWSTISADPAHGLVYVPTGSASPDYFGGLRPGDDRDADSVVALRASDGHKVWAFQLTHHDLWDYDVAAQPLLFTWKNGTPALAVTNKSGNVFVLNRLTGRPLVAVTERPVPQTDVAGEHTSPTQPFSALPPLAPQSALSPSQVFALNPADKAWCEAQLQAARSDGIYTPPSLKGSLNQPGNVGGVNWGSLAYDPARHLLIADVNNLIAYSLLIPRADYDRRAYRAQIQNRMQGEFADQAQAPYGLFRNFLLARGKVPCNPPPWGSVVALDLFGGRIAWSTPLGTLIPGQHTGSPNLGGPIVTAGGLVFTAAGEDDTLHAYDASTGRELWSYLLPAGGNATPMTYEIAGKQYLVICAGGHGKLGTKLGDAVLAFALP